VVRPTLTERRAARLDGQVTNARLDLTRAQILAFRRRVGALEERLPAGARSLRRAAWAGLQDSMPRAALLSIHARVERTTPSSWEHPSLAQVWGPRFSAYVVPARDVAVFTLGRLPEEGRSRRVAEDLAARAATFLAGRKMSLSDLGHAFGCHPNTFRYAAPTGTLLIRWDGARRPTVWSVRPPRVDPPHARLELARRYLHIFGPTTAASFVEWAGVSPSMGQTTFAALARSLTTVRTPTGDAWILTSDEPAMRAQPGRSAAARLLPSGDTYFLLQGSDRALLVPDAKRRSALWTSRVWPGAILVRGEIVGTWRRPGAELVLEPWRRLTRAEREAIAAEAEGLPLPDLREPLRIRWSGP
jgi:hypothetical protein